VNLDNLQQCYEANTAVRVICDHMADRANNQNETLLHRISLLLAQEGHEFKRSDLIAGFRRLEEAECGNYVEGRHGWKSRFVWSVKSKLVSGAAKGTETKADLVAEDADEEESAGEMIEHAYVLRPDLTISFELPTDLTVNEASRLAQFIGSLSFDD
jgi:hypothetical protein